MLQQELAHQLNHPCFSPAIYSIDEFIRELSPLNLRNDIELLAILYQAYQTANQHGKDEPVAKFISWAETFIHDCSEIDMQLADASQIFGNIKAIKDLDFLFNKNQLSSNQQKYLSFYASLFNLYLEFNRLLDQENAAYEGKIYKNTAEHIMVYAQQFDFKRYIFAGFHTISPSEMSIISYYCINHQGELYFDLDELYYDSITPFIKQLQNRLKINNLNWINRDFFETEKNIKVVGAARSMNQILYAIDELNRIEKEEGNLNNTVLAFADEKLITPFIHCYDISKANLTMGYPLSATPSYTLLSTLTQMARNGLQFDKNQSQKEFPYYHRDVMSFFHNPLVCSLLFDSADDNADFINKLISLNKIFFSFQDLNFTDIALPELSLDTKATIANILNFFIELKEKCDRHAEQEFNQYCLQLIIENLQQSINYINGFNDKLLDFESAVYIINSFIHKVSIPLKGSPTEGLQLMGLLETRTLDFKNVIVLSVNEGIIPTGRSSNSLILFDVKKHFGLPTFQEKDTVYGYHFFRLLQRATNITLLYNTESGKSPAEQSRFIKQLKYEKSARQLDNIHWEDIILPTQISTTHHAETISITKNPDILAKLLDKEYSYSHLNDFINCPLQFYFRHIAHIQAADEISESVEQKLIGNAIHNILEKVGNQLIAQPTDYSNVIKNILDNLENVCKEHLRQAVIDDQDINNSQRLNKASEINVENGKLYLAFSVIKKSIKKYLETLMHNFNQHKDHLEQYCIKHTEKRLVCSILVNGKPVKLKGYADRIDYRDGRITLLDYKTGKVDKKILSYNELNEIFADTNHQKILQLLMYGYLYSRYAKESEEVLLQTDEYACGIISFQNLYQNKDYEIYPSFVINPNDKETSPYITKEILVRFEEELTRLLSRIINPAEPFYQTEDSGHCKYCDYRSICLR